MPLWRLAGPRVLRPGTQRRKEQNCRTNLPVPGCEARRARARAPPAVAFSGPGHRGRRCRFRHWMAGPTDQLALR